MVERDKVGGTCINVACIPTKSLVGSARTIVAATHADVMGIDLEGEPAVSLDALRRHKESVIGGMVEAHRTMFQDSGMDFMMGTARFVAPRTVQIATNDGAIRVVRGKDVVVNTGTTPALPNVPGVAESDVWTSASILRLDLLPERLLILGGGYVGCEFASMFALFGTEVVLVQGSSQVLPREDGDIAGEVAEILSAPVGLGGVGVDRDLVFGDHHLDVLDGIVPGEQDPLGPELQPPTPQADDRRQDHTGNTLDRARDLDSLHTVRNSGLQLFGSADDTRLRHETPLI